MKNKTLEIGITGGIGTGKSLVSKLFAMMGVPVYDADSRAKTLLITDPELKQQVQAYFGADIYDKAGQLNRSYLARKVFNGGADINQLNKLVHPRVGQDYLAWVAQNQDAPYLLKEAALMFESGSYQLLDRIIVVYAPLYLRLSRIKTRDPHRTTDEVQAIINKQLPEEEKIKRADFVIENDETKMVIPQVVALHELFLEEGKQLKA